MGWLDRFYWSHATELGRGLHKMLTDDPESWSNDGGYYLRHESGEITFWIANRASWLRVKVGRMSSESKLRFADRHLLWRAIRRMGVKSPEQIEYERSMSSLCELQTYGKIWRPKPPVSKNA